MKDKAGTVMLSDHKETADEFLWSGVATEDNSSGSTSEVSQSSQFSPVFKANVTIEGVKTCALLDHGSQVTIFWRQVLPAIRKNMSGQRRHVLAS